MRGRAMRGAGRGGFGIIQWMALCAAACAILGLTFALGLFMGRQWARPASPTIASEPVKRPVPGPRRGGLAEPDLDRPRELGEKLTFYHTLTAPLPASPPGGTSKPRGEEPRRSAASPRPERAPEAAGVRLPPASPTVAASMEDGPARWSVQVASLKNRRQADGVQKQLADAGFTAYVTAASAQDGQPRYRVRVGTFKTREDAVRTAERVRAARALPTFVTSN